MEKENDSTTVSTETTEEKGAEVKTETSESSKDTPDLKSLVEAQANDIASLKRTIKKLSKPTASETPEKNHEELSSLQERLDKQTLRGANITHQDDIKLAQDTAKKWNMSIDDLVYDEDFVTKLEKQRTNRANADATTNVKGNKGSGGGNAKHSADYWISKGVPPTPNDVPDRKVRTGIIRDMMKHSKQGKKFYND